MFDWLTRLFTGHATLPAMPDLRASTVVIDAPFERAPYLEGGPIRYQPSLISWRHFETRSIEDTHTALLFDQLQCAGRVVYTYMLVVTARTEPHPVLFVTAEVNAAAPEHRNGSHALGVFDVRGHCNLGFSDDWGDSTKFFPKAFEVAAGWLSSDPWRTARVVGALPVPEGKSSPAQRQSAVASGLPELPPALRFPKDIK